MKKLLLSLMLVGLVSVIAFSQPDNGIRITEEYGNIKRVQQKNPIWYYYYVLDNSNPAGDKWNLKWAWNSKTKEWWRSLGPEKWASKPEYKTLDETKLPE